MINILAEETAAGRRPACIAESSFVFMFYLLGYEAVDNFFEIMEEKISPFLRLVFGAKAVHFSLPLLHLEPSIVAIGRLLLEVRQTNIARLFALLRFNLLY